MFKQAILAATTATVLAAGGLAVSASTASAAPYYGGQGWNHPYAHNYCRPIVKNVKWWDRFGRPHWRQVVVGRNCGPHRYPHPYRG